MRFKKLLSISAIALTMVLVSILVLCFVPPVRDKFFGSKVWPFATPWDVTPEQIEVMKTVIQPGDVIVERNIHSWQWMTLCLVTTGSTWVHTAIFDKNGEIVSMMKIVKHLPLSSYLEKQSTDMVLIRPPYRDAAAVNKALAFANSQIGTEFDPTFEKPAGSCNGLIATSLAAGGIKVAKRPAYIFGKIIHPASEFFNIPSVKIIWKNRDEIETK